jgi:hypothetical protein
VEYITAIKECLENNYLDIPGALTLDSYLKIVEDYYTNQQNNPAILGIDTERLLFAIMNEGGKFENDNTTECVFNILKEEHFRIDKKASINIIEYEDLFKNAGMFIDNNYLFNLSSDIGYNQFENIHIQYNIAENMYNSHLIWYPSPVGKNGMAFATIDKGFLINNNSKHKNEAFEFIEFVLSNGSQSNTLNMTNLPVNLSSYNTKCKDFIKGLDCYPSSLDEDGVYSNVYFPNETVLPDEIATEFLNYVNSAKKYHYLGNIKYVYNNILYVIIEDYYNDRINFDDLINAMNSKLEIYHTE